ncbi:MAG: outer membrane beta-barrel domain-containing protein [Desulfuromusa sp.]|nr:outer membrane beta-barrel domain-containing protein [Desulfuromusa sp.]
MCKKIVFLSILILSVSLPAVAKNQSGAATLSTQYGRHILEGNQSLETTNFWGIGLGYNLTANWAVEGFYTRTESDAEAEDGSTTDTKVETYHLDTLYHFRPDTQLVPYVVVGLGAIYSTPEVGPDRDHFLFNYGVGIKYFFLDDLIALRGDIRHLVDFPEPDNNLQYSIGLTFQLGKPKPAR